MRVSVVVPLYNKAAYIRRALDSIASQTFTGFEVIVVDDGSTDASAGIARDFPDPRFRLIQQPNRGPGNARNRGLAEAKGELMAFLDADDEWLPNYLEESLGLLDSSSTDVVSVTSGYFEYPQDTSTEKMWRRLGMTDGPYETTVYTSPRRLITVLAYMSPCSTLVRTATVRKYGGFYEGENCRYGEDAFLWLKVLLHEKAVFNLKPLVKFHREAASLSKNLRGARPVEPFLTDPERIEAACPNELRELLAKFLAARAFKTACVLGYWGHWSEARTLMQRFKVSGSWRLPYYVPALVCITPLGANLGRAWRALLSRS